MKRTYVLVHGAWHGAWCWKKVLPLLRQRGHRAVALDLAGHGEDHTPVAGITLETYVDQILSCVHKEAHGEPVTLVGHSFGGLVITQAAERSPDAIRRLVYVAALLPGDGESMLQLAQTNPDSVVLQNLMVDRASGTARVRDEAIREAFFGDCTEKDVRFARRRMLPEPLVPLGTPVHVTPERFGRVPRIYVEALEDRAMTPAFQKRMYEASPCDKVLTMQTSHSPFFSEPDELVDHLTIV